MSKIELQSSPVLSEITHHAVAPEATVQRVAAVKDGGIPLYRSLMPLQYLDVLGIPVYAVVRDKQLRSYWGKGLTPALAQASGVMETVERFNAQHLDQGKLVKASCRALGNQAVSRWDFGPTNLHREFLNKAELDRRELLWYPAYSLFEKQERLVPSSLVGLKENLDALDRTDSNGLASGNTMEEAILHGICELIERHCYDLHYYNQMPVTPVDPDSVSLPQVAELVAHLKRLGWELLVAHHSLDFPVPTLSVFLLHTGDIALNRFTFLAAPGTHPHPEVAFLRCLTEIAQTRVRYFWGKAMFKEYIDARQDPAGLFNQEVARRRTAGPGVPFSSLPNLMQRDIKDELRILLRALENTGCQVYVADLTSQAVPIPTVRVLIRGLQPLLGHGPSAFAAFASVSPHLQVYDELVALAAAKQQQTRDHEDMILAKGDALAKKMLFLSYRSIKNYARARHIGEQICGPDQRDFAVLVFYGEVLWRLDQTKSAASVFLRALQAAKVREDTALAAHFLSLCRRRLGQDDKAREYRDMLLGLYPEQKLPVQPRIKHIYRQAQLDRINEQIANLRLSFANHPSAYLADQISTLYSRKYDHASALEYAGQVVALNPKLLFGWQHLITCLLQLGRLKEAAKKRAQAMAYFMDKGFSREQLEGLLPKA